MQLHTIFGSAFRTLKLCYSKIKSEHKLHNEFRVHNGNLVVESKDRNSDHGDYIYHKLSVPKEVDFKTIQTKVVGDKLIVSADKHIG